MKRIRIFFVILLFLITVCWQKFNREEIKIFQATDIHYISQQLTDNSKPFVDMLYRGDGKMTHYIDQITDAFIDDVINQKPEALLISGDITFNGELLSHKDFAKKLSKIEEKGIQVLVIPGNHDVGYPYCSGYSSIGRYETPSTSSEDFEKIYNDFGLNEAYSRDENSFSYMYRINDDVVVAAIDSNTMFMSSAVRDDTLEWLEKELAALSPDTKIITMTHQSLLYQNKDEQIGKKFAIYNNDELIKLFEKYGVDLSLSGHIHMQHIAQNESGLTDIATASLALMKTQYGVIDITKDKIEYHTQNTDVEKWANEKGIKDENLLNFNEYSKEFYIKSQYDKFMKVFEKSNFTQREKEAGARLFSKMNSHYFLGTLNEYYPEMVESVDYKMLKDKTDNWHINYIYMACDDDTISKPQTYWKKDFVKE